MKNTTIINGMPVDLSDQEIQLISAGAAKGFMTALVNGNRMDPVEVLKLGTAYKDGVMFTLLFFRDMTPELVKRATGKEF